MQTPRSGARSARGRSNRGSSRCSSPRRHPPRLPRWSCEVGGRTSRCRGRKRPSCRDRQLQQRNDRNVPPLPFPASPLYRPWTPNILTTRLVFHHHRSSTPARQGPRPRTLRHPSEPPTRRTALPLRRLPVEHPRGIASRRRCNTATLLPWQPLAGQVLASRRANCPSYPRLCIGRCRPVIRRPWRWRLGHPHSSRSESCTSRTLVRSGPSHGSSRRADVPPRCTRGCDDQRASEQGGSDTRRL